MPVNLKRAYLPAEPSDGRRYLVDGLWPRGLSQERLRVDRWLREIAPSPELRRWYGHEPGRFAEFRRRYRSELALRPELLASLVEEASRGTLTLVFGARDETRSNAAVLRERIEEEARRRSSRPERTATRGSRRA